MDPVSLGILFGSGFLMGKSYRGWRDQAGEPDPDVVIRPIFRPQPDGWMANELCTLVPLEEVGQILDLDLATFAPMVQSGFFRVVAITSPGAPLENQVIAVFELTAPHGFRLSEAYRKGYQQVDSTRDYEKIGEVLEVINADQAKAAIADLQATPSKRERRAKIQQLQKNPDLALQLESTPGWSEVIRSTPVEMGVPRQIQADAPDAARMAESFRRARQRVRSGE